MSESGEKKGASSGGEKRVFLSHSTKDKAEVQRLREALADRRIGAWEDVLELRLGSKLGEIQAAIREADGFVLLLTPASIGSDWVQREARWALETKLERPGYALLPVLRGLDRPALKLLFGEAEMVSFVLGEGEDIVHAAPAIVQAFGLAPQDATARVDPLPAPPMAELLIELEEPKIHEEAGTRRAAARARVRYVPAGEGRGVNGQAVNFVAPLGAIEAADLRWYLEDYGIWPFGVFKKRATGIEDNLKVWGKKLFDAVLGRAEGSEAFKAWRGVDNVDRRVTVMVDDRGPEEGRAGRLEASAMLLALPWELLADEGGYLFEGRLRARVRRMLPSERAMVAAEPRLPLRILLVLARPEDKSASFIDPRASAIPLAEALEGLGESVELSVLSAGTMKALREALDAAERAGKAYQVVHFDGHGVYDAERGLGRLCFEKADDVDKGLLVREAELVDAAEIGAMLRERRVPLFVLEACQTAMTAENPTASVAAELLRAGVASVVAMSHSVLVETARRFVRAFYGSLAEGDRIGTAMVRAQHALKDDRARGERNAKAFELSDWMVPVLFQEDADARLFPSGVDLRPAAVEDRKRKAKVMRGELPDPPGHGFVGRGKALLAIDRLLVNQRWVSLVGAGGQGKTALAVEAARWLLAMRRVERVAFVSVENLSGARAVLDAIGRQLVPGYAIAMAEGAGSEEDKRRNALLPVGGVLQRRKVLIVVDNLESVLPEVDKEVEPETVELLKMIRELSEVGETRVILTSREVPPDPLGGRVFGLPSLGRREGLELLAGVLKAKGIEPYKEGDKERDAVEDLVDAVGGHARSLVLLGELVAEKGAKVVAEDMKGMMVELEKRYPDKREQSLIASVRMSLKKLPEGMREKIRGLAVFQGAANVGVMAYVLQMKPEAAMELCRKLVAVGLADMKGSYLLPDPGLGTALSGELKAEERDAAEGRWIQATRGLVRFLYEQQFQNMQVASEGTRIALTGLLAVLAKLERDVEAGRSDAAEVIDYATNLEQLISHLKPLQGLLYVANVRRRLSKRLSTWGHANFLAESEEIERMHGAGKDAEAILAAKRLRDRVDLESNTFPEAVYDRALARLRLGIMLREGGYAEEALPEFEQAGERFFAVLSTDGRAALMQSATLIETGKALCALGRFEEAAITLLRGIARSSELGNTRSVTAGRAELGNVRLKQGDYVEALVIYQEVQVAFEALGDQMSLAAVWHQIGEIYAGVENFSAAERAYKESLLLRVTQAEYAREAHTIDRLGSLYSKHGRLEDAVALHRQAVDRRRSLGNRMYESSSLNNLGIVLSELCRYDEAREALLLSLAIKSEYGHEAMPWTTWSVLEVVERSSGRPEEACVARQEALRSYRSYRVGGGEPKDYPTRFIAAWGKFLMELGPTAARAILPDVSQVHDQFVPALRALQSILDGVRDPTLADDPALHPQLAVELTLLLESLTSRS
ncbi:MAG: CHAT domain-containing protein [Byssovorax sp.]